MPEYNVTWTIGSIDADTPEDAARQCREMLLDPANLASYFVVTDEHGNEVEIDTLTGDPNIVSADKPDSVKLDEPHWLVVIATPDRPVREPLERVEAGTQLRDWLIERRKTISADEDHYEIFTLLDANGDEVDRTVLDYLVNNYGEE